MIKNSHPMTFLWFCYLSAILTIVVFLTLAQVVIQLNLSEATRTRAEALVVHRQEVLSQKLLRNAILLLVPGTRMEALKELKADIPTWEREHESLEKSVLVALPTNDHHAITSHYRAMDQALHALVDGESRHYSSEKERTQAETPQIGIVFYNEIPNITALDAIFTRINAQADSGVAQVRLIEVILYMATLVVMLVEFFVVVRPARQRLQVYQAAIEEVVMPKGDL